MLLVANVRTLKMTYVMYETLSLLKKNNDCFVWWDSSKWNFKIHSIRSVRWILGIWKHKRFASANKENLFHTRPIFKIGVIVEILAFHSAQRYHTKEFLSRNERGVCHIETRFEQFILLNSISHSLNKSPWTKKELGLFCAEHPWHVPKDLLVLRSFVRFFRPPYRLHLETHDSSRVFLLNEL